MYVYPTDSFHRVSTLLERSAHSLGATAITLSNAAFPLHVAMDEAGPLAWALTFHAAAIATMSGLPAAMPGHLLPFTCIPDEEAPLGHKVIMQPSSMPISAAYRFLDAALEHCICIAMRQLGYTPEEWAALPEQQRAVPIGPYLHDLSQNWITETIERGNAAEMLANWPELLDQKGLPRAMSPQPTEGVSHVINFPSAR